MENFYNPDFFRIFADKSEDNMTKWESKREELDRFINVEGLPYDKIGKIYGCSGGNIRKQAKILGINMPRRRCINPNETFNVGKTHLEVVRLLEETGKPRYYSKNYNICPNCGQLKYKKSNLCQKCRHEEMRVENSKTLLGYYIKDKKYLSNKCSVIRQNARKIMDKSGIPKHCSLCGDNHEFDDICEVHHIKGILTFDVDTELSEINDIKNLMWVCPSHHAMLDKGLISL